MTSFATCMADCMGLSDLKAAAKWAAREAAPRIAGWGANRAAERALRRGARAREIAGGYANMMRAQGQMEFAGNRVTKEWHTRGTKLIKRFRTLKGLGRLAKWASKASGWITAGQAAWCYGKCFGS
jgi:hypothetical protein